LIFINNINPRINSRTTTIIENAKAYFSKNGKLKTIGEKYSSNLKENPFKSTAFTNPEAINISATIYRRTAFIILEMEVRGWKMDVDNTMHRLIF